MNAAAYRRNFMVDALENYSFVVVVHAAMVVFFPKNRECKHWNKELKAFASTLHRYNKGKSKSHQNLVPEQIFQVFVQFVDDPDGQEQVWDWIERKGLSLPAEPDWDAVKQLLQQLTQEIVR